MNYYSKELIINRIVNRDDAVIRWLYIRVYGYIEMFILKRGGTVWDVMDIFQDGMLVLYEKVNDFSLLPGTNMPEYLFGICKYLWYKKYRRDHRLVHVPDYSTGILAYYQEDDFPIFSDRQELKYILYLRHVESLKPICQQLLAFYRSGIRVDDIVREMNFTSRNVVYKKKFECMRRLISYIRRDPDYAYL